MNRWNDVISDDQSQALFDLFELESNEYFDTAWKVEMVIRIFASELEDYKETDIGKQTPRNIGN